jgi:hypothetical protein
MSLPRLDDHVFNLTGAAISRKRTYADKQGSESGQDALEAGPEPVGGAIDRRRKS